MSRTHFDISDLSKFLEAIKGEKEVAITSSLIYTNNFSCGSLNGGLNFYCGYPQPRTNIEELQDDLENYYVFNQEEVVELPSGSEWAPQLKPPLRPDPIQFEKWQNICKAGSQMSLVIEDPSSKNQHLVCFVHLDENGISIPPWSNESTYTIKFSYDMDRNWELSSISITNRVTKKLSKFRF